MNELLTVGDVARELRVSKLTIRRWINSGKLKALQISTRGDKRVRREELTLFLRNLNYEN